MKHATFMASLVVVAASTAAEGWLPISIQTPAVAQAPADPPPAPEMPPAMEPEPAPTEPPPVDLTPAPAQLPSATPSPTAPPPLPFVVPPTEFVAPEQGEFAPVLRVVPAHRLAMMEAGRPLPETDPLVARSAVMLAQLTGHYLEDAPRIVDLTIKACAAVRLAKSTASPLELLEGALNAKRPAKANATRPRQFEKFATSYRIARLEGGKDHAGAIAEIQGTPAAPPAPR
ncbi:hypothetical protein V5E97_39405 [Singulisphaera sp. Ch08]|uniref:Uncharacterized protein n=1 Tax=Singulisphaera sp. Ch08 TaxID=3120278 RepID=A0AAU7CGZ3_9BACT